jgi:hypothetical protein
LHKVLSKGGDIEIMNDKNSYDSNNANASINCNVSKEVKDSFRRMYKCGIYKELHKRKLLSDAQLDALLSLK